MFTESRTALPNLIFLHLKCHYFVSFGDVHQIPLGIKYLYTNQIIQFYKLSIRWPILRCSTTKQTKWHVPSEDSDQSGHLPSLISLRSVLIGYFKTQGIFMQTAKSLIRLGRCPGWSESSLGVKIILFVLSCCGSFYKLLLDGHNNFSSWSKILTTVINHKLRSCWPTQVFYLAWKCPLWKMKRFINQFWPVNNPVDKA